MAQEEESYDIYALLLSKLDDPAPSKEQTPRKRPLEAVRKSREEYATSTKERQIGRKAAEEKGVCDARKAEERAKTDSVHKVEDVDSVQHHPPQHLTKREDYLNPSFERRERSPAIRGRRPSEPHNGDNRNESEGQKQNRAVREALKEDGKLVIDLVDDDDDKFQAPAPSLTDAVAEPVVSKKLSATDTVFPRQILDAEAHANEEALDIPDQERNYRKQIVYNDLWTIQDERELRKAWSEHDQRILRATGSREKDLWRKSVTFFKMVPPDLIPKIFVSTIPCTEPVLKKGLLKKGTSPKETVNWSSNFCREFAKVMCLPCLKDDIHFLRFVLVLAVACRVGDGRGLLDSTYYGGRFSDKAWARLKDRVVEPDLTVEKRQLLTQALRNIVDRLPEHWVFQEYIQKHATANDHNDVRSLQTCDLKAILWAWNEYVEKEKLSFLPYDQYPIDYNKQYGAGHAIQDAFDDWKKEWILSVRRRDIRRERRAQAAQQSGDIEQFNRAVQEARSGTALEQRR